MCRRITCPDCGKPSFAGCGRHVESVLGDIPSAERCRCKAGGAGRAVDAGGPSAGPRGLLGLLGLFGGGRERRRP
jgi:hypothetical protein